MGAAFGHGVRFGSVNVERLHPLKYRSIWISDVHLGFRGCQADFLLDFLQATECKQLYLVGDIIDVWAMKNGVFWPQSHNNVVRAILDKARGGTEVIYVPGNHDEILRAHIGSDFGNVAVRDEIVHTTADGRRFLILHGDKFDHVVQHRRWLAVLGAHLYDMLLSFNHRLNWVRKRLGLGYWSLAAYLKHRVKDAVNYIGDFEQTVADEAKGKLIYLYLHEDDDAAAVEAQVGTYLAAQVNHLGVRQAPIWVAVIEDRERWRRKCPPRTRPGR